MAKHLFILTGASRGMGYAMAEQLLKPEHDVLCISRNSRDELDALAAAKGASLTQWRVDLSDASQVCDDLRVWLSAKGDRFESVTLINNAALLPKISPLREATSADIAMTLRVGLESVMQLTAAFLGTTQSWQCVRKVLNISSGNGRRAMASQSIYSAVKAGMDHYTRCVAEEEKLVDSDERKGAKVCSLAPGIIDTDMQTHLRETDPAKFPSHQAFVEYKRDGHLLTPEAGAARVLAYLARADFGVNPVADVRDA